MWDPATGHWTLMARAASNRLYHSIALLLPDGRVLTGGGGHPGDDANFYDEHPDFEIYEPPYLFQGARPIIDAAPDSIQYSKPFALATKNSGNLKVSLFRLGCATHAWDHNTDFTRLAVTRVSATSLQIEAPSDSVQTTPGPHRLFLVDSAGIPSVAKMVWVNAPSGGARVADNATARQSGMVRVGNHLHIESASLPAGAECRLQDARGRLVAVLAQGGTRDFALPRNLRPGKYVAVFGAGAKRATAEFMFP